MYVSKQACSSISYFNLLAPAAEFPHTIFFSLRKRVRQCLPFWSISVRQQPESGEDAATKRQKWPVLPPLLVAVLMNMSITEPVIPESQRPGRRIHTVSPGTGQRVPTSLHVRPCVPQELLLMKMGSLLTGEPARGGRGRQSTVPIKELFATYFSLWSFISQPSTAYL